MDAIKLIAGFLFFIFIGLPLIHAAFAWIIGIGTSRRDKY